MDNQDQEICNKSLDIKPLRHVSVNGFDYPEKMAEKLPKILDFEVADSDVWVTSYPKSGTTWTQEMVWLLANDLDYKKALEMDLDERFPFLEFSGIPGDLDPKDLPPKYLRDGFALIEETQPPRFIKTHLPWDLLPKQIQSGTKKSKIVDVIRNPKDVCVSKYHHGRMLHGITQTFDEYCENFLSDKAFFGPYWKIVDSYWKHRNDCNMIIIKYEDMKSDLSSVIRKVSKFLEKAYSDAEIIKLCEHLSFDSMKKNNAVNKHAFLYYMRKSNDKVTDGHFLRSGKVGDHKTVMSEEMAKRFDVWENENRNKLQITL